MNRLKLKKDLSTEIEQIISEDLKPLFFEGVINSITMYEFDTHVNPELKFTPLTIEMENLNKAFSSISKIISQLPDSSLEKVFSNSTPELHNILAYNSKLNKIPDYNKNIWEALSPLTEELEVDTRNTLNTLFSTLSSLTINNKKVNQIKNKQLQSKRERELVFNVAHVFVTCGGTIGCKDTDLFNIIIYNIFKYTDPEIEKKSIVDYLRGTCGGKKGITENITRKHFMKDRLEKLYSK
jgi:hypothetical protein